MTNEQIENELEHLADEVEHVGSELEHLRASIHKDFDDFRANLMKRVTSRDRSIIGGVVSL